jgi:hypothetical protein
MPQDLSGQEFQLGLTMAGAISAGAYSAGVLDFLVRALQAWEEARLDPKNDGQIPNHRVGIKVMTGASAGAITAGLGVVGLAQGATPTRYDTALKRHDTAPAQQVNCVLPCLYDAWVVKPALVSDGGVDFLATEDIGDGNVASLLNSTLLDKISEAALKVGKPSAQKLPYVSETLHVYMTLTNLRGVPYQVAFEGGSFGMQTHGDRVHYAIKGVGAWKADSPFADHDQATALSVDGLFAPGGASDDWQTFTKVAVASGAFPAGLAARSVKASLPEYDRRAWPMTEWRLDSNFKPSWPSPWGDDRARSFWFLAVDGGVVNNDPFEYAHFALMEDPPHGNPRDGEDADRAVIMIDPFPEPPEFLADGQPDQALVNVLKALIPALINQARFKPAELALAASEAVYSRYMIAPSRPKSDRRSDEVDALACGLLGGFGGFLLRPFREHDFILGQRNCQQFLRSSFALPAYNKIIQHWPQAARDNNEFLASGRAGEPPHYRIIPLIGEADVEVAEPPWPKISPDDLDKVQARITLRLDEVARALIASQGLGGIASRLASFAYSQKRSRVLDFIRLTILADLVWRDQIEGWELPDRWRQPPSIPFNEVEVRTVLATLLDPSFDLRNAAGIAAAAHLDIAKVYAILAACQAETGARFEVWQSPRKDQSGAPLYALASRKPSRLTSLPVIRQATEWAVPPRVDPPGL